MIVDFHTHIFPPDIVRDRSPYLGDPQFNHLYHDAASTLIDHTALESLITGNTLDYAVAMGFPWHDEDPCERQNSYFSHLCTDTDSIIPFGSVPLCASRDIEWWVSDITQKGLAGIGEIGFYENGFTKKEQNYLRVLLGAAAKAGLPVCLHVNEQLGHHYPGKYSTDFVKLLSIISDFPEATLILAHWGGGIFFYELMPEISKALASVWYDTAATPLLYDSRIYHIAVQIAGPDRILFGSDYPLLSCERYTGPLRDAVQDEYISDKILGGNAARLLGITSE